MYEIVAACNNRIETALGRKRVHTSASVLAGVLHSISKNEPIWFEKCEGVSGPCESKYAYRRHQNTAYEDDSMNYRVLCDACQEESDVYWQEMWDEYYRGCL